MPDDVAVAEGGHAVELLAAMAIGAEVTADRRALGLAALAWGLA